MDEQEKRLLLTVGAIALVLLIATCVVLCITGRRPSFSPPQFDPAACQGTPTVPDGLGWKELYREGMTFRTAVCGRIVIQNKVATVFFTNHQANDLWLKLRILDQKGNILGETGLLRPGEYLPQITFDVLPEDGQSIVLKIMSYQPETYYSGGAISVNTVATLAGE